LSNGNQITSAKGKTMTDGNSRSSNFSVFDLDREL
jgi:hypothetical protein